MELITSLRAVFAAGLFVFAAAAPALLPALAGSLI